MSFGNIFELRKIFYLKFSRSWEYSISGSVAAMRPLAAAVEPPAARDRDLHRVGRVGGQPRPLPAPPAQAEHRLRLPLPPAALLANR